MEEGLGEFVEGGVGGVDEEPSDQPLVADVWIASGCDTSAEQSEGEVGDEVDEFVGTAGHMEFAMDGDVGDDEDSDPIGDPDGWQVLGESARVGIGWFRQFLLRFVEAGGL